MVVAAFSEQRYELGLALARLCAQAARMEQDTAVAPAVTVRTHTHDLAAPCRYEGHPNTPHLCSTGGVPLPPNAFETAERPLTLAEAMPAPVVDQATEVIPRAPVLASARCLARLASGYECNDVLQWVVSSAGPDDPGYFLPAWEHIAGPQGHAPLADRPDPR
jgi:hypothetical protein